MADGINIPGITDKYKTNDLVEALMEVERIPLKREEANLGIYNKQQEAWRNINQKMSTLRDSAKTLYSFDNPFNNRLSSSSDEVALTVDAGREASFGDFKVDVIQVATADRFLSAEIEKDYKVRAGIYTYKVGNKTIEFNWKGGKISDFVVAANKRGNNILKMSLIGINGEKNSLLIECLKTGQKNSLFFEGDALSLAKEIGMLTDAKIESVSFAQNLSSFKNPQTKDVKFQEGMPEVSKENVLSDKKSIVLGARAGFETEIPEEVRKNPNHRVEFSFSEKEIEDITIESTIEKEFLSLPSAGQIEYEGIMLYNNKSESTLPPVSNEVAKMQGLSPIPADENATFFIKNSQGDEIPITDKYFSKNPQRNETWVSFSMKDFPDAQSLIVRNSSTGNEITMSIPTAFDEAKSKGYVPNNAISTAADAIIKYEGITMTRSENDIDDVLPYVTLHLHEKSERPVKVTISPDTQSAKDAIITFVGKYNQTVAEMNILSINKAEVISELDYLTKEEQDEAMTRLGIFQGDFTLTNGKASLQRIASSNYRFSENAKITLLAQIGISTNATGGTSTYSASQLRGYLEVDEKKLDVALRDNLNEIKNIFGFDSDGDLIIDDGIALKMDKQLMSWVQSGGIISTKTSAIDKQIHESNTKITKLQTQLDKKESELKQKYASMQGSLNELESQQSSLENFTKQQNNSRK